MLIRPARRLRGRLRVPGDKSVSHRAAMFAALAEGRTRIDNFSSSADCSSTLEALRGLGVEVERDGGVVFVGGAGGGDGVPRFRAPAGPLDCGNSGTTMRLLAGVLAAQPFASVLTGDESLSRRPMRRVMEPLGLMGARLSAEDGHAPLRVEGRRPLKAVEYVSPVASAQVKSCVLLAGLGAEGRTRVTEPELSRDHTERMLRWFGVPVESGFGRGGERGESFSVGLQGPACLRARDVTVPGDVSSAAFLVAAAAMLDGSEVTVEGVGLNATRAGLLDRLEGLGAGVRARNVQERCNEPVGEVLARCAGRLRPTREGAGVVRGAAVPGLIDELPLLAVLGTHTEGGIEIRDARELRVKESDRISAVVTNLRAMGAEVEEFEDGLRVGGPVRLRGARLQSYGDHRIAMAFAVAGLAAEGETEIEGAEECVAVSFPEFFPLLESLTER
ncbi:MAG TPA: 3-phosphoshikimate 1-carboxyvinyltransferase [Pyrinomonadaceae bacterium]|jgi:3-phosphoshikimate 1-carboxyvinyltransferase